MEHTITIPLAQYLILWAAIAIFSFDTLIRWCRRGGIIYRIYWRVRLPRILLRLATHTVTEREWQQLMDRLKKLEAAKK